MRRRSRYGWLELIEGILLILLGIYTLCNPGNILSAELPLRMVFLLSSPEFQILYFMQRRSIISASDLPVALVTGILSLLAGLMLLMYPNAGELIMTLLLPIWFIAHSVSRLTHIPLVRLAGKFYYYFTLIVNILGITLGCLMIIWPWVALFSTGFIIGGYLILLGIDCVVMACSDMDAGWM